MFESRSININSQFQGTFVMTAFYSSHRDPSIWEEPEAFMPERFLDASGKLCLNKDKSVPFSAGKCSYAMIFQHFLF